MEGNVRFTPGISLGAHACDQVLSLRFSIEALPDLKKLLDRALNTWDEAPKWAWDLEKLVSEELAKFEENLNGS